MIKEVEPSDNPRDNYFSWVDFGEFPIEWGVSAHHPSVLEMSYGDWLVVETKAFGLYYTNVAMVESFERHMGARMQANLIGYGSLAKRDGPSLGALLIEVESYILANMLWENV